MKVSLAEDKLVGAVVNCQANQLELLELNCEEKKAASKSRGLQAIDLSNLSTNTYKNLYNM